MSSPSVYRALVVDDESLIRRLIAKALQSEGIECDLAAEGQSNPGTTGRFVTPQRARGLRFAPVGGRRVDRQSFY
jgi:CheY-like chemotaxis protein